MTRPGALNYIVYAPRYDGDSGGSIFLHQLVHTLNSMGERAAIWPWSKPAFGGIGEAIFTCRTGIARLLGHPDLLNPELDTPIATRQDLAGNPVVVYPEVTFGNPLKVNKIARWLLYQPGLKDPYRFTENEVFFCAGEMSDLPKITGGATELTMWKRNPVYRNTGQTDRKGACYLVRKGHEKARVPETENATCIDTMSHQEIADTFNRCEIFYSYDEASFYSQYAALCGCLSVVIPGRFKSREEWVSQHNLGCYGVAYGIDDIAHARSTMGRVEGLLAEKELSSFKTVEHFVDVTKKRFLGASPSPV